MGDTAPLTIVHTLAPAPAGGLESVVRLLAAAQAARGHRVIVLVSTVDAESHPFAVSLRGMARIEVRGLPTSARDFREERRAVTRLLREIRPDVVHSHGYRPDILHLPVARACGVGAVSTLHGFTGQTWKVRWYERLQLRSLRRADAVIAVSRGVYDRARRARVPERRIHTIRNAYSLETSFLSRDAARALLDVTPDARRIAWIGRLSVEKGADVMLDAFAALEDRSVSLSVIGDGPWREALVARARELGLERRVTFHGVLPNAARLLPAFDAFVSSSRTEGTPMVVLEAMAAGTPIVATRVGGIPDMLSERDAWLVPPERPEALATAIRSALEDRDAAQARARAARARLAADFSPGDWLDRHDHLYRAVRSHTLPS